VLERHDLLLIRGLISEFPSANIEPNWRAPALTQTMAYAVILEGGSPWGFRLSGGLDFNEPLKIGKVSVFTITSSSLVKIVVVIGEKITVESCMFVSQISRITADAQVDGLEAMFSPG
jgi:hypothetical protein